MPRPRSSIILVALALLCVVGLYRVVAMRRGASVTWPEIQSAVQAKKWNSAESLLNRWLTSHSDDGRAWLQLGALRSLQGRDGEAILAFETIKATDPHFAEGRTLCGDLELKQGNARAAEALFRQAIATDSQASHPLRRLIYLLLLEQRAEEARNALWTLHALTRDTATLVTLVGLSVVEGDSRDVAPELDRLLKQDQENPWLRRARGLTHVRLGRAAEALADLEFADHEIIDDPSLRLAKAEALLLSGELAKVEGALGSEPSRPAELARWWLLKAQAAELKGDRDGSFKALKQAVEADGNHRVAVYKLGQELNRRKLDGQAELSRAEQIRSRQAALQSELDKQLKGTGARDSSTFERIGGFCRDSGLPREARAWYEQSLRVDPTRIDIRASLSAIPEPKAPVESFPRIADRPSTAVSNTHTIDKPMASRLRFRDEAEKRGLVFTYDPHAKGDLFIGDTMGGGVALFDFDNDGDLDVYLVGGCLLPVDPKNLVAPNKLFRNKGDGTFEDVTGPAKVGGRGYGMGATVGDYDGDGHEDLFITGLGSTLLYRNKGDGTFEDVTAKAGVSSGRWSTASGFADLDDDGDLDIVVVTYVEVDPSKVPDCRDQLNKPIHCPPTRFPAQVDHLFRNNGDGTFTDVAASAGLNVPKGDGLGLAIADFDQDGRLDLFVANDTEPNFLFRNLGGLKFEEVGVASGVALDGSGRATASMGVVADDLDGDGLIDLFHTNFNNEPNTFLKGLGSGLFRDATAEVGLDAPSRPMTGFGVNALDVDNDGRLDLFVANGHVDDQPWFQIPMAQSPQLFEGGRGGRFRLVPPEPDSYFARKVVGRGSACGDLDGDGKLDLVVVHRGEPVSLLRNVSQGGRPFAIRLKGRKTGRQPVGAKVTGRVGGKTIARWVATGTSYLACDDPTLWIGAGSEPTIERLEVTWPGGRIQGWSNLKTNAIYELIEGGEPTLKREW